MRDASEELGEATANAYMMERYPNATQLQSELPGDAKQGQFDQIYLVPGNPPEVIFVEAKGGASDWGSRKVGDERAEQGSTEYMNSIIDNYTQKYDDLANELEADPKNEKLIKQVEELKVTLTAIKKAQKDSMNIAPPKKPVLKYVGVKQKANDSGIANNIDVTEFKVEVEV